PAMGPRTTMTVRLATTIGALSRAAVAVSIWSAAAVAHAIAHSPSANRGLVARRMREVCACERCQEHVYEGRSALAGPVRGASYAAERLRTAAAVLRSASGSLVSTV